MTYKSIFSVVGVVAALVSTLGFVGCGEEAIPNPDPPAGIFATVNSSTSITLSWGFVSGASGYYIYRSLNIAGPYNQVGKSETTLYTDNNLSAGTTYYYRLATYNRSGTGSQSSPITATTKEGTGTNPGTGGDGCNELRIELEGSHSVVLYTNQNAEFQRLMGLSASPWTGVVKFTEGAGVEAVLTRDGVTPFPYDGSMPPPGSYIIRYIASKPKCGNETEILTAYETRQLEVREYIPDTSAADIYFCPQYPTELTEGASPFNELNCITKVRDETLTRKINGGAEEPLGTISTAAVGTFTIAYTACRTYIVNDNPVPSCTTVTKTVTVKPYVVPES